ncbi:hypothetical protein PIB30_010801 [Stylosanthes scabra]|uniref:DUF4283 domain-containing protein n=1 Tax=Stylosanthes scabra TaxID=79078 RepID=A0ABU6Q5F2_9FABA|nr:hypothetical protein [Stylosanthes scabra]
MKASASQKEFLGKSILAESFQPIKFGSVVHAFKDMEKEYGRIEYRDLGPRKYILMFESIQSRDKALTRQFMPKFFDEVRSSWGYKWSLSKRIWLELMGLSIHTWHLDDKPSSEMPVSYLSGAMDDLTKNKLEVEETILNEGDDKRNVSEDSIMENIINARLDSMQYSMRLEEDQANNGIEESQAICDRSHF